MDTNLNNTSMLETALSAVEASTVENNGTTSTPQIPSAIATVAMDNEDSTADASLQLSTSPTSATMSNIDATTSTAATTSTTTSAPPTIPSTSTQMSTINPMAFAISIIPSAGRLGRRLPLELRLAIYFPLLYMTIAGSFPPILLALSGTCDYPIVQAQFRIINFVLSDATLPVFSTITMRGNKLKKLLYLHIRSDDFRFYSLDNHSRSLLNRHNCKIINYFRKITFIAIQPTRTPQTIESELFEANANVDTLLNILCEIVNASVQAPEFRLKFLGYNNGNWIDQRKLDGSVALVNSKLAVAGRVWTRRRELIGEEGVVHDGIVWIWERV